jgi:hypothetical protein
MEDAISERLISSQELKFRWSVKNATIQKLCAQGVLQGFISDGRLRFRLADIEQLERSYRPTDD